MSSEKAHPLVSLIVPIYNVERWLSTCLDSIQQQVESDWEAILVNDGSTDGSGDIAELYASRDQRFRVIHQKNKGLGGARNSGVELARGEYLFFIDSDDVLPSAALWEMCHIANEYQSDIVVGDFYTFVDGEEKPIFEKEYASGNVFKNNFSKYPDHFRWTDLRDNFTLLYQSNYFCVAWGKLYRAKLWKQLRCEAPGDLRMAEDFVAVKKMTFSAQRISQYRKASVLYRKRSGSMTMLRNKRAFEIFRAYKFAIDMFKEIGLYEEEYVGIHSFFILSFAYHLYEFIPIFMWREFYNGICDIVGQWDIEKLKGSKYLPLVEKYRVASTGAFVKIVTIDFFKHKWLPKIFPMVKMAKKILRRK